MDPHPRLHQQDHGIHEGEMQADDPKGMEAMEKKLEEIEDEASAQKEMQSKVAQDLDDDASAVDDAVVIQAKKEESDSHSIFVGNVDYACTPEEIQQHFESCGTVNRVTILTDKFGQPKGYAYVEFVEIDAVQNAVLLSESELRGRQLKVSAKRTNVPGMKQTGHEGLIHTWHLDHICQPLFILLMYTGLPGSEGLCVVDRTDDMATYLNLYF